MNRVSYVIAAAAAVLVASGDVAAQDTTRTSVEAKATLARRGAGIAIGSWSQVDVPSGPSVSDSPVLEGYFRKGIDKHLAFETSAGLWRRELSIPASGGIGGAAGGRTTAILIPQLTSLKLYPFTGPDDAFEPFASGGLGFVLGFVSNSGGGGILGGGGGGSGLIAGVGATGSAGFEWRFSTAFGMVAGAHYTYTQFFDDLAGQRMYRGTGVKAGLTYRFQY